MNHIPRPGDTSHLNRFLPLYRRLWGSRIAQFIMETGRERQNELRDEVGLLAKPLAICTQTPGAGIRIEGSR